METEQNLIESRYWKVKGYIEEFGILGEVTMNLDLGVPFNAYIAIAEAKARKLRHIGSVKILGIHSAHLMKTAGSFKVKYNLHLSESKKRKIRQEFNIK